MRQTAPAAERNRGPIVEVLRTIVQPRMRVLEIASGTGQHTVAFAEAFPDIELQPTDIDDAALSSIGAWVQAIGGDQDGRVRGPIRLDVRDDPWPVQGFDLVVCINMIHISPWEATQGLMRGAAKAIDAEGWLYLYGPYHLDGQPTAESNVRFDQSLRARNPAWGVRDLGDVEREAGKHGWALHATVPMPANNLSVIFRHRG